MARIGKVTVFIDEARNGHTLTVSGTGRKGDHALSAINAKLNYNYVNPGTSADAYVIATLNEVIAALM
jgi:hypothetical protein